MMQKLLYLFLFLMGSTLGAAAQDALLGKWWSPKRDGQIEFYKSNDGKFYGRLVWARKGDKKDTHNPDPALRARALVGSNVFTNFSWDGDEKEWIDGKVYDPGNGKVYNCKLWITDSGKVLNARGFVGFSLLGRTEKFARVD